VYRIRNAGGTPGGIGEGVPGCGGALCVGDVSCGSTNHGTRGGDNKEELSVENGRGEHLTTACCHMLELLDKSRAACENRLPKNFLANRRHVLEVLSRLDISYRARTKAVGIDETGGVGVILNLQVLCYIVIIVTVLYTHSGRMCWCRLHRYTGTS
jgi:hypothetical protein